MSGCAAITIVGNIFSAHWPFSTIASLVIIYPALALYAERWHDRGKSGWWSLMILIPLLGLIYAIGEIGIQEGQPGFKQYGPNPLGT